MKRSILILLTILIVTAAISQTTYYKGEWSRSGTTYNYTGFLKLTINGKDVQAEAIWKLITPDKLNKDDYEIMKDKVGLSAVEILTGNYDPQSRDLNIQGIDKVDPHDMIDVDVYTLKISSNSMVIFGKSYVDGGDNGCFYALLQKTSAAAIEYAALRKKIK